MKLLKRIGTFLGEMFAIQWLIDCCSGESGSDSLPTHIDINSSQYNDLENQLDELEELDEFDDFD